MHTKSSINIKPVSGNSEVHNLRTGNNAKLNYIRQDRTHLNKSWVQESVTDARKRIEETYKNAVGQKMQEKATPIREGVVNLGKDQNIDTLTSLSDKLKEHFGIKTIQIHIHEDEGYHQSKYDKEGKEIKWKQNRHAHIVFDWTDEKGKSLKLNKGDMADMQTIVAKELGMERGQSSDRKHLNAMEYKLQEMEKDALQLKKDMKQLQAAIKAEKYGETIKKGASEGLKRLVGLDAASKFQKQLKSLKNEYSELSEYADATTKERDKLKEENASVYQVIRDKAIAEQENREKTKKMEEMEKRLKSLAGVEKQAAIWKNNCLKIVKGEVSIDAAKEFMIKEGYIKPQGRSRGIGS